MRFDDEPAYVLEARPYRETSLLLELLTASHGRLAAVARGVRGASRSAQVQRAALQPFRRLRIAASGRGEVLTLGAVEAEGSVLNLAGYPLFSAWYVNELVQRLTGRADPVPDLFRRYADWLGELAGILALREAGTIVGEARPAAYVPAARVEGQGDDGRLAWSLRRFERDLVGLLGYALVLDEDCLSGQPLRDEELYCLDPEHGARPWRPGSPWPRAPAAVLRAWAGEVQPPADQLRALRPLARALIRHHLGGEELRAWRLAAQWRL